MLLAGSEGADGCGGGIGTLFTLLLGLLGWTAFGDSDLTAVNAASVVGTVSPLGRANKYAIGLQ